MAGLSSIGKEIHQSLVSEKSKILSAPAIDEFFENLSPDAREFWPFDFKKEGYKTTYTEAHSIINPNNDSGIIVCPGIQIAAKLENENETLFMRRSFFFDDDQLTVSMDNLYREKGAGSSHFATGMMRKLRKFIETQDANRNDRKQNPSELVIEATSNNDRMHQADCGGYIWANHGFNFATSQDLNMMRRHFQDFSRRHGVEIADNDLKHFTKPCHFAAFHCGVRMPDKFGNPSYLGKAFLLMHESWKGRLTTLSPKSEEKRYAEIYNRVPSLVTRRRDAFETLNPDYRHMLKKYYEQYRSRKSPGIVKKMSRLVAIKTASFLKSF